MLFFNFKLVQYNVNFIIFGFAWCFSTKASVARVLSMNQLVSSYLLVTNVDSVVAWWHQAITCTNVDSVVAWWHQAITWPDVDLAVVRFCGTQQRPISQEVLEISICEMSLKNALKNYFKSPQGPMS